MYVSSFDVINMQLSKPLHTRSLIIIIIAHVYALVHFFYELQNAFALWHKYLITIFIKFKFKSIAPGIYTND